MTEPRSRKLACLLFLAVSLAPGMLIPSDQSSSEDKYAELREIRRLTKSVLDLVERGVLDSAMTAVDSVLAVDSSNADGWYQRGIIQLQQGDTAAAQVSLSEGADRAPLSTRLRLLMARLSLKEGNWSEAEAALDQVLAIKPDESEALYLKGLALLQHADTTTALESFEHALTEIYPSLGGL